MEERANLRTLVAELLEAPLVRIGAVLFGVLLLIWGISWFFGTYRPMTYLREAYPIWHEFETAVDDARDGDYRYDPYGVLELNLERVESAAADAGQKLPEIRPPRPYRELHAASLEVIGQYLAAGKNFSSDLKTEADYYYTLLVDLRNLFEFANSRTTILHTRANVNGSQYEDTFRQYQVLSTEIARLLTRAEVAKVPERLKEYHGELLAFLREIESVSRQGIGEFADFQLAMNGGAHQTAAAQLASLQVTMLTKAQSSLVASEDPFGVAALSGIPSGEAAYSRYLQQSAQRILDEQKQFALMLDYSDFLRDLQGFYQGYDRLAPPRLTALTGVASLVESGNAGTYAAQWNRYMAMTDTLSRLAFTAQQAVPPAQYKDFHIQATAVLNAALKSAQDVVREFETFNLKITDHRFRDLDRKIAGADKLVGRDLDFADLWNLKDLTQVDAAVAASLDEVKNSWREALQKYDLEP